MSTNYGFTITSDEQVSSLWIIVHGLSVLSTTRTDARSLSPAPPSSEELKKHEIVFVFQSDQMVTLTSDFEVDSVLCFDFNISAGKDAFSERMEAYMHGSENVAQIEECLSCKLRGTSLKS